MSATTLSVAFDRMKMSSIRRTLFTFLILGLLSQSLFAQLPQVKPELVSISSSQLALMDALIEEGISQRKLPGAVVLVGRKGKVFWY